MDPENTSDNNDSVEGATDTATVSKSLELAFETMKHLTTLRAGSTVLIATFLKDIFPKTQDGDELAIGLGLKVLLGSAFFFFALSLLAAAVFMYGIVTHIRVTENRLDVPTDERAQFARAMLLLQITSPLSFIAGSISFGSLCADYSFLKSVLTAQLRADSCESHNMPQNWDRILSPRPLS